MEKKLHFSNLHEYHQFLGLPPPEHPLISVTQSKMDGTCIGESVAISTDFYSISLKHITQGEIYYGRTKYDFKNGSLICTAPRQVLKVARLNVKSNARTIIIHEDFLRGTSIQKIIESANYFSYAVNEALHLSPREEGLIKGIFDVLAQEYEQHHDAFSKDIMVSQLNTMLTYAERFYQRQFQQRMESPVSSLQERFISALKSLPSDHIPTVEELASELNVTPRYLSDGLKVETGKTALENIHSHQIDRAKNLLLGSDDSVATIAYALGFEYPQYFSRLFKNKVGMTPTEYRNQSVH
ncbi:helix-turn-helix transcriptional regulator [Endozoicomonas sp. G2_1]|uniref:helix-turn-helix domain-containing protein n=1 Tax=Endozoicomonas sp. G2_1 TaxID=2821091 RepID=UPI001AD9A4A6|nr:AraC family transcriptional regulator [Endozoicomonas sp. G2_1]MBO9489090.1 helix-turn-helix transcriptional regulator [Endozoicomonas sp. G2_1]